MESGRRRWPGERLLRLIFFGTPPWAVPTLDMLVSAGHSIAAVVTAPDAAIGRSRELQPTAVKIAALAHHVGPIVQPPSLKSAEARAPILAAQADALIVVAYGRLLPGELLDATPHGAINLHFSLLPRHRGASPVQHTLLMGDEIAGITTMQMDRGLDTGPILLQRTVELMANDTTGSLGERMATSGASLVLETLRRLEAGTLVPQPQDATKATLAPLLTQRDGLVVWSESALRLERRVRAFDRWPTVVCRAPKGNLRLLDVRALPDRTDAPPGTVLERRPQGVVVAAGGGSQLLLERVQPAGARSMDALAALDGGALQLGVVLGDGVAG